LQNCRWYVICVIHRLYIFGSCNIKFSSIKSLQNSSRLRYNYFCKLHVHIQTIGIIKIPCLALQVTTTLLCVISGIAVYQNSRYTQLRPENTPLPSSITMQHTKRPHNQASDYSCETPTQSFSVLNYNHYCICYEHVYTFGNRIPYLAWQVVVYGSTHPSTLPHAISK
jgi:hypothetical protein